MDPADHEEIFFVTVIEHGRLILRFARVGRTLLIRNQEASHEECIVNRHATEDATHLETRSGVLVREFEELMPQISRQENGTNRLSVL